MFCESQSFYQGNKKILECVDYTRKAFTDNPEFGSCSVLFWAAWCHGLAVVSQQSFFLSSACYFAHHSENCFSTFFYSKLFTPDSRTAYSEWCCLAWCSASYTEDTEYQCGCSHAALAHTFQESALVSRWTSGNVSVSAKRWQHSKLWAGLPFSYKCRKWLFFWGLKWMQWLHIFFCILHPAGEFHFSTMFTGNKSKHTNK